MRDLVTFELGRHLVSSNTFCVQIFGQIQHNVCLNGKGSRRDTIVNALHRHSNLAEDPHFKPRVAKFVTLEVRHLEAKGPHQVVVEQGGGRGGEVRGHQAGKRSSFYAKYEFFFIVAIFVSHGWFIVNILCFVLHRNSVLDLAECLLSYHVH